MANGSPNNSAGKWWLVSLVIIAIAEALVCAVLFIPQAAAYRATRSGNTFVNEQLEKLSLTSSRRRYIELAKRINEAQDQLTQVNLFSEAPAQEVIMRAISRADKGNAVAVLGLERAEDMSSTRARERARRRPHAAETEDALADTELGESWRLRCKSDFTRLVAFLNGIERQGILLDSSVFSADNSAGDGTLEAEVLMRVFSRDALDRLKAQAADKAKKTPAKKAAKKT